MEQLPNEQQKTGFASRLKRWFTFLRHCMGDMRRTTYTVAIAAIALILIFLGYGVWRQSHAAPASTAVTLEDTAIDIESVMPRGELYVCTAVAEDFVTLQRTGTTLGIFTEEHSCVQILRQKVSFKIDLRQVRYTPDTLHVMIVEMPPVEYVASTQDSPFMSDDEDFWASELRSTNGLKRQVEQKIRRRFDTEANHRKAERYAQDAIRELLWKLGYEARFAPQLTRRPE